MIANPVFGNELRKSLVRRKPIHCFAVWAAGFAFLVWLSCTITAGNPDLFYWFPHILLPVVAPGFAAGAFAKEREQRTWQDLFLTRLTTREILFGKFWAAYLPVVVVLLTLIPPVMLGYYLSALTNSGYSYSPYSSVTVMGSSVRTMLAQGNPWPIALPMIWKCTLQAAFYVVIVMVCSHYCRKARVALAVSYVAMVIYAIFAYIMISSIDTLGNPSNVLLSRAASPLAVDAGEKMHLLTCAISTAGAFLLLSVGLRFDPEK